MSAWRIGTGGGIAIGALAGDSDDLGALGKFTDKVVKWIPGDVVTLYLTAITLVSNPSPAAQPSVLLWLGAAVTTAAVVWIAASRAGRSRRDIAKRVALGVIAFFIWSTVIPMSGWGAVPWVADNLKLVAALGAFAGLVFAAAADAAVDGD